jgi:hypothetical protein
MAYAVGQVLYVVSKRKIEIVPVQIVEELTSRTLSGEEKTYRVKVGNGDEIVTIDRVDGEMFEHPNELADTLMQRASVSIKKLVDEAVQRAHAWYPGVAAHANRLPAVASGAQQLDEEQMITLPDGTIARVKLPPEML